MPCVDRRHQLLSQTGQRFQKIVTFLTAGPLMPVDVRETELLKENVDMNKSSKCESIFIRLLKKLSRCDRLSDNEEGGEGEKP